MDDRLRAQQLSAELNLPLADSRRFDAIEPELARLLPAATLAALRVVPLGVEDGFVLVACADPEHLRYMKELARYLRRPVRPVLAARRDIARTLRRLHGLEMPSGWLDPGEPLDVEDNLRTPPGGLGQSPVYCGPQAAPTSAPSHPVCPTTPVAAPDEEPPLGDATVPMTAEEVRRVLADYAASAGRAPVAPAGPTAGQGRSVLPSPAVIATPPPRSSAPPIEPPAPARRRTPPPAVIHSEPPPAVLRSEPSPPPAVGARPERRFAERYRLVRRLATGGMAEVHLARVMGAEGFEREVVVKKILPCFTEDTSFVEMFIDEAKIACRLNHPNIAQVYELAIEDDEYYMAMEYVDGKDLLTLMEQARRSGTRIPPAVAAYIVASILEGLEHAHAKRDEHGEPLGIVHRDVTPSNILISWDGHVKIIDFGIAKAREKTNVTRIGYMKGKPGYLAPEQAKGEPVDRRVDVFAAGILLYELLSNERLFSDSARASAIARLVSFDVTPLLRLNLRIPWALRRVVRQALALQAEDRFSSALEMATPLATFMRRKSSRDPRLELRSLLSKMFPPSGGWTGPTS